MRALSAAGCPFNLLAQPRPGGGGVGRRLEQLEGAIVFE